jgi:DNA-binding beta-propeller fold protein YncE
MMSQIRRRIPLGPWLLLFFLSAGTVATLFSWRQSPEPLRESNRDALRAATGGAQLTAAVPMTGENGEMCEWMPASMPPSKMIALQARAAQDQTAHRDPVSDEADREPVRTIKDTYPTYSAIAVDLNSNEVYMQDENLFGYRVFNRMDNTPANAAMTEPKRIVQGLDTGMEFNCGLYVDPKTGDVYSVNNDTQDSMVIFPRDAKGNVKPKRRLTTPHGTYGIAVDEVAEEIYMTVEHDNSVVVFHKFAEGDDKPLREMKGDKTLLADPHGIAIDVKNQLMFVANHGSRISEGKIGSGVFFPPSITVYALKSKGEVAPLRIIQGDKTGLNWPAALAIDEERGEIYVANDAADSMLVFKITDNGDVAPTREVRGPRTQIKNPTGVFVDSKNKEVWLSNMGNHRATVFPISANGNAAPARVIRSAPNDKLAMAIGNPGAVGYDTKREEILVPN